MKIKTHIVNSQGPRPYMEDTFVVKKLNNVSEMIGVFDGHGGIEVAAACRDNFASIFSYQMQLVNNDVRLSLTKSFHLMDQFVKLTIARNNVGSTAVVALLTKKRFWFANAGDSMAMIIYNNGQSKLLSEEHKAESEEARIVKNGGLLTYWDGMGRVNGTLNLSRSIGDHYLKKYVLSTPYITNIEVEKNIKYVVLASDGIWDVYDVDTLSKEIYEGAQSMSMDKLADSIVMNAYKKGSTDNITLVISTIIF